MPLVLEFVNPVLGSEMRGVSVESSRLISAFTVVVNCLFESGEEDFELRTAKKGVVAELYFLASANDSLVEADADAVFLLLKEFIDADAVDDEKFDILLCRRVVGARGGGSGFDFCDFGLLSGLDDISWLLSLVMNDLFFCVFCFNDSL